MGEFVLERLQWPVTDCIQENLVDPVGLDSFYYSVVIAKNNSPDLSSPFSSVNLGFPTNTSECVVGSLILESCFLTELVSGQSYLPAVVKEHSGSDSRTRTV